MLTTTETEAFRLSSVAAISPLLASIKVALRVTLAVKAECGMRKRVFQA
jgi:hypothetical protein